MKILVVIKRVEDPEMSIKVKADNSWIEDAHMKYVVNPFDEIAVEEALRVRDANEGEVIVACIGAEDATQQIRTALAMGADRAVHLTTSDFLDPNAIAQGLKYICEQESPDLVLIGKQAVDDDMGIEGILLAASLGWGQATFASKEASLDSDEEKSKTTGLKVDGDTIEVIREVDGGIETLKVSLPAVVTTELRLNIPRYTSLPGIMKAKKKEIKTEAFATVVPNISTQVKIIKLEAPKKRAAGAIVADVATLMDKLRNEAKALA